MTLQEQVAAMIEYMHAKIAQRDWHGVSDVANDLREMEAAHGANMVINSFVVEMPSGNIRYAPLRE